MSRSLCAAPYLHAHTLAVSIEYIHMTFLFLRILFLQ